MCSLLRDSSGRINRSKEFILIHHDGVDFSGKDDMWRYYTTDLAGRKRKKMMRSRTKEVFVKASNHLHRKFEEQDLQDPSR
jgi:hypothetical protein